MPELASPCGILVRGPDKHASQGGAYHAARSRDGRSRFHEGIDICTVPGQPILASATCVPQRIADPYPDEKDGILLGLLVRLMDGIEIKYLYMKPATGIMGRSVPKGTVLGVAQSLQHLYPGITDHIHVEVWIGGERRDPTPFFIDPPDRGVSRAVVTT